MYDMNAMYLYPNGYRYEVGSIRRVNEKTVTMSSSRKIDKEEFETKAYKLTEEEIKSYKGEIVKKLSFARYEVREMISDLTKLRECLNRSYLATVNTEKLQATIDNLEDILRREIPQPININSKDYKFEKYGTSLEEVNEIIEK